MLHDELTFESILLELDLAVTFCTIGTAKTEGNLTNAKKAFSEGVRYRFYADEGLSREARHQVIQKLDLLKARLRDAC